MAEPAHLFSRSGPDLPFKRADYYQMIRSQIDAENELSNMRVIWLLIGEAFFVGGFGTIITAQGQAKDAAFQFQQDVLFWIIPIAGLIAAILGLLAILASMGRVRQFEQCYAAYEAQTRERDNSTEGFPPLQDQQRIKSLTTTSLLGLPFLFVAMWIVVLCLQLGQRLG